MKIDTDAPLQAQKEIQISGSIEQVWSTFRVPNDPGAAPVAIPGYLRLAFELALFAFAVWALFYMEHVILAWSLGVVVGIHAIFSYDRILWIIKQ